MLPLQPIQKDATGVSRFRANAIVCYLLANGGIDLNELARVSSLSDCQEDWEQFAQLIGYSVSGFGELSYVSDKAYEVALAAQDSKESLETLQIRRLEERLQTVQEWFKQIVPELFGIHPDDLKPS